MSPPFAPGSSYAQIQPDVASAAYLGELDGNAVWAVPGANGFMCTEIVFTGTTGLEGSAGGCTRPTTALSGGTTQIVMRATTVGADGPSTPLYFAFGLTPNGTTAVDVTAGNTTTTTTVSRNYWGVSSPNPISTLRFTTPTGASQSLSYGN